MLQVRLATGLVEYPTGKSAMVHYENAVDVRAAATALAARHAGEDLLCRHLEIQPDEPVSSFHAKLVGEFTRRFGSPPSFSCISSKPRP